MIKSSNALLEFNFQDCSPKSFPTLPHSLLLRITSLLSRLDLIALATSCKTFYHSEIKKVCIEIFNEDFEDTHGMAEYGFQQWIRIQDQSPTPLLIPFPTKGFRKMKTIYRVIFESIYVDSFDLFLSNQLEPLRRVVKKLNGKSVEIFNHHVSFSQEAIHKIFITIRSDSMGTYSQLASATYEIS
jgi:hypothetical protein